MKIKNCKIANTVKINFSPCSTISIRFERIQNHQTQIGGFLAVLLLRKIQQDKPDRAFLGANEKGHRALRCKGGHRGSAEGNREGRVLPFLIKKL